MYVFDDTVDVVVGSSYYARSRVVCTTPRRAACTARSRSSPSIRSEQSVTFRYLVNNNCGYLSLEPGLPRN